MSSPRPTVILADVHLGLHSPPALAADLARLLDAYRGAAVTVVGDFVDLVAESPGLGPERALQAIFGAHPPVRRALGEHLEGGGRLHLTAGNHDAALGTAPLRAAAIRALQLSPPAAERLRITPWFWRRDGVHIEHGHLYDPDNAPAHPLVLGHPGLGAHFSAEFLNPTGAHAYLQVPDATPLELLLAAFRWYGRRGPYVVYRYFYAALGALGQSGPWCRGAADRAAGYAREAEYAARLGLPTETVRAVLAQGARPTLERFGETFARLYLDRVLATLLLGGGLAAAAGGRRGGGGAAALAGALVMIASWAHRRDRYRGAVTRHLEQAAARIRTHTGAELIILGHTHREADRPGYHNTGSFAFPRTAAGRPYLLLERGPGAPRVLRCHLPLGAASVS